MNLTSLRALAAECAAEKEIMTQMNSLTMELWHVYPNGLVVQYNIDAEWLHRDWDRHKAMLKWSLGRKP